jgi:hypothetical protein
MAGLAPRTGSRACHVDSEGHAYDFGLNWSGVIRDERTENYRKPAK